MADVWDGGTATTGIIKYEFNTDKTAIRFSRTDLGPFPPAIPTVLTAGLINALKVAAESLERVAGDVDKIDATLAATLRSTAAAYRAAGAIV